MRILVGWVGSGGVGERLRRLSYRPAGPEKLKTGMMNMILKTLMISFSVWVGTSCAADGVGDSVVGKHPGAQSCGLAAQPNTLTAAEVTAGWRLLWDGKTAAGWRSAKGENFPAQGWVMQDGVLSVRANSGEESTGGGDILTRQRYADFELLAEFKITPGANSGIKIFVQSDLSPIDKNTGVKVAVGSAIGCEFQILDDVRHPDAKLGRDGNRTIGSLYDLIPAPADKKVAPIGEWNQARIVSRGQHVEFWLNGQKTVAFERGSEVFRKLVAASKFKNIPDFGEWADGHILLQDHGDAVSYRNLKIRELKAEKLSQK